MLPVYTELYCRSNFSFQVGASHAEEMVRAAVVLGYRGLAITDECSLAGSVRAYLEVKELAPAGGSFGLITGASFSLGEDRLLLLAHTRQGYGDLSALITRARQRSAKGEYRLELSDLATVAECSAIVLPGPTPDTLLDALVHLPLALGYSRLLQASDGLRLQHTLALSRHRKLPVTACGDVVMHEKGRKALHDILSAVRHKTTVAELGKRMMLNGERSLRPIPALANLYPTEWLMESVAIAERCTFTLDELRYEYPEEIVPPGQTLASYLRSETYVGAARRYGAVVPETARALIEKELALIAELNYEAYFLTVYDVVKFARSQGILCQGRGSAANSAVCYCLAITEVDPARMSMLFERFVSKERNEPPDIDVDFEHQRREEVIQYIYRKYGRERAALCAAVSAYRTKGALRDVGKALGFSLDQVDKIAKNMAWWDHTPDMGRRLAEIGFDEDNRKIRELVHYATTLVGFPRHLSQHPGGFVIARDRLDRLVPIENAAMPDRTVIQWDKDDIDTLGLMKVDVLGLGMLSCIRRALDMVSSQLHRPPDQPFELRDIPAEDPKVYDMLCRGESTGVFQVESRAQMSMLPRLKPRNYFDLVIEVAIVRPGPIQGGMVHPYLKRRQGLEKVSYPSAAVEVVLQRTLGIPIFQEQVMQLAMVAAGFTAGEADQLRRAMAAWKRRGGLGHLKDKLTTGMLINGYSPEFAESIYKQIAGFGTYGFPESHAASFALLVYASAWLKCHHPAAFCAALLNSFPMGFYSPSQLIQDAQRNGVTVLPIDVMQSTWESHLVPVPEDGSHPEPMLRLGLRLVSGLSKAGGERLVAARSQRQFRSLRDLATRAALDQGDVKALANSDALRGVSGHRLQAVWAAGSAAIPDLPLAPTEDGYANVPLSVMSLGQEVLADFRSTGLTLRAHPVSLVRHRLQGTYRAADLVKVPSGRNIRVGGLVTCRQRPGTASGVTFVTLEDETGNTNVVVWRDLAERERRVLLSSRLMIVHGKLEHQGAVTHLIAAHLENASHLIAGLDPVSHDFH
jgi:error-prone DNA polymerase